MKRILTLLFALILTIALFFGWPKGGSETIFDTIKHSPAARMELPDGSFAYMDSEISSIYSFADLELMQAPMEPADKESDWLYRIIFNPSEKVTDANEVVVSFHIKYVQINHEFYLTAEGVEFDRVLEWARSKFDYFIE